MFKVEESNQKIGRYLAELIDEKYESRRKFCKAYLELRREETGEDNIARMANRISQIINGNKAIQIYDLPFFTEMLGVSCEQLLSAGECATPISNRVTNYSVACSNNPKDWQKYIERKDNLILNEDEYCKTIVDYAIEFKNYKLIKFLMDKNYIWFDSHDQKDYIITFGAGSSFKRRDISKIDWGLEGKLKESDKLRTDIVTLAVDNKDFDTLNELHAREIPQLYCQADYLSMQFPDITGGYNEKLIKHIASAGEVIQDYFTDTFTIQSKYNNKRVYTFMYPYISELLDEMIAEKSDFLETALKKCIKHNKSVYKRLSELIQTLKNDEYYAPEYMKETFPKACKQSFEVSKDESFVLFRACLSNRNNDGIITNIAHIKSKKLPQKPSLKHLAEELNESYEKINTITEHLEEF